MSKFVVVIAVRNEQRPKLLRICPPFGLQSKHCMVLEGKGPALPLGLTFPPTVYGQYTPYRGVG